MIGAGSIIFSKTLMMDLMATPDLGDIEFSLMGPTMSKLEKMKEFADDVIKENKLRHIVNATTDRRKALDGADFVVLMFQIGGVDAFKLDYEIPQSYGVDQCIADSMGPGGVFRALRTIPVLMDIAKDISELCPDAYIFNYVNPMAMVCWTLGVNKDLKYVGLCHGVQTTMDLIAGYLNEKKEDIDYTCAGINHMAWFLKLEKDGIDMYPKFKDLFEKPEYYINEKVRGEVLRQFGYFMTESTGHLSEYLPWFRSSKRALDLYCDMPDFGGESGAYYKYCKMISEKFQVSNFLAYESKQLNFRSNEFCSYIIEALSTNKIFKFNGNVRNDGYISNLPDGSCVEVPVFADKMGLHPVTIGKLPVQCAALNMTNINVQGLAVEAGLTGDSELVVAAVALDGLTSSVLTLKEIRDMVTEMFKAETQWLPQFKSFPKATPTIDIPSDIIPVDVPIDPALAIANRFGKLAQM